MTQNRHKEKKQQNSRKRKKMKVETSHFGIHKNGEENSSTN